MSHMDRVAQARANGIEPTRAIDLDVIRERAEKAAPGPWYWSGSVDSQIYLSYWIPRIGRGAVMTFCRHGMQGAQPMFVEHLDNGYPSYLHKATEVPIFEVCAEAIDRTDPRVYRGDIVGFRNPNAEFIAHARQDVADLLAHIDALERALASQRGA